MASVELRKRKDGTDSWRVSIRKKGFPEVCKTFLVKEEAENFAKLTESSMDDLRNKKADDIPFLPLSIFIDRYRNEIVPVKAAGKHELVYLAFWEKALGTEIAREISPAQVELHADSLYKIKGRSGNYLTPETRRKYLAYLSVLYTTAIKKWRWAIYNPVSGVDAHHDRIKKSRENPNEAAEDLSFVDEFKKQFCFMATESMRKKGLSQREAANNANLTLHTLQCAIDPKNNPTIKNILKLAKSLDIRIQII